jgi:hypothetical protein
MLERLSNILSESDYKYIVTELSEYKLDEDAIYSWIYTLTPDRLKSRYITVSIINQVKEQGKYIIKQTIKAKPGLYFHEFWKKQSLEIIPRSKSDIEFMLSILYEKGCPLERLRRITDCIRTKYHPENTDVFLALLKTTKPITDYGIDLTEWETQARDYYESYEKMMGELETVYD